MASCGAVESNKNHLWVGLDSRVVKSGKAKPNIDLKTELAAKTEAAKIVYALDQVVSDVDVYDVLRELVATHSIK